MESIIVTKSEKEDIYREVLPQIESVISSEVDLVANLANVCAILKEVFNHFWVGFYIVKGNCGYASLPESQTVTVQNSCVAAPGNFELVLGPFQGPLACTRIKFGRGVCGAAWREKKTLVVPDVDKFPGHIACSSLSRSEIVVPVIKKGTVVAVLDIDSKDLSSFDATDARHLESLSEMLSNLDWNLSK